VTGLIVPRGTAPDGRPWVQAPDRAAWRAWLGANHATSSGVYLVTWRGAARRRRPDPGLGWREAIEEAVCVGWVDSKAGRLDDDRTTLWFTPRRPGSTWGRANVERVTRLAAAGLMLPAGLAAVEDAKRRGAWPVDEGGGRRA
jgi:uncharacterized protein YdeI (YjbR/CyaY-like superfamily)